MKTILYTILAFTLCISSHFTQTSSSGMIYQLQQPPLSRQEKELAITDDNRDNNNTAEPPFSTPTPHAADSATDIFDIHKFIQLFTKHLLMDHYDKAYTQLSKRISFQFRDAIQLRIKKVKKPSATTTTVYLHDNIKHHAKAELPPPVDVQVLKRQLKGAVGSFIEDKLPILLLDKYNTTQLEIYLLESIKKYCPGDAVTKQCLLNYGESFLSDLQHYTAKECQATLIQLNNVDLPRLFEKTRAQISGILVHFNQHTMDENLHMLELRIKTTPANTRKLNSKKKDQDRQIADINDELDRLLTIYYQHIHLPFLQQQQQEHISGPPTASVTTTTAIHSLSTNPSRKTLPTVNRRNWITQEMVHEFIAQIHHTLNEDTADSNQHASIQYFIDLAM